MAISLPSWWEITPPHEDIRSARRLDESIFAADLGEVLRGVSHEDYQDPNRFFAGTFLSVGLRALLTDALREVAGQGAGNRVIQIETPFGGGKTHTLVALYHLFASREQVHERPEIRALLASVGLTEIPVVRVAAIVGNEVSALEPAHAPDGTALHTLWGHLAYDLAGHAGYERLRIYDERRVAPPAAVLRDLFALTPARLILMDELVTYLVPASGQPAEGVEVGGGSTLKDQTITFLQNLTQAVAQTPRTLLVLTLPSSHTALYGQAAAELQQKQFRAGSEIGDVVGRVQTLRTPVQGDDIHEVLRRRLLEQPATQEERDSRERRAREVAKAYVEMYAQMPHDVPEEVQHSAYIERIVRSYPFHPDVVRILYERWGTLPDFQRTRGALRILGLALAHLYAREAKEPLVLPAHISLDAGDLRNELLRILDNTSFNSVLDSDVASRDAKADAIDQSIGREHARFQPARRVATTIFLWSFTGGLGETRGATEAQIRVGSLKPGMEPAIIGNVLNELRRKLWYLHEENGLYRFDTQANLNRVIVQKEEGVPADAPRTLLEKLLTEWLDASPRRLAASPLLGGGAGFTLQPYRFPQSAAIVPDVPLPGVVLLSPAHAAAAAEGPEGLPPLVGEILRKASGKDREHRNVLILLVPERGLVLEAERAARRLLALRAAASDSQLALPVAQQQELVALLQQAEQSAPQQAARIYRYAVIPADQAQGGMVRLDLGQRTVARGDALWDDAVTLLIAKGHFLDALAPSLLVSHHLGLWADGAEALNTQKLWDAFVTQPHLPILAGKEVLIRAIERGCTEGLFGYAVEVGPPPFSADHVRFGTHNPQLSVEIAPTTWLVRAEYARARIVPRDVLVRDIPPTALLEPAIWPTGSQRRRLSEAWRDLEDQYAPQVIDRETALVSLIFAGVKEGHFRLSVDGGEPLTDAAQIDLGRLKGLDGIDLVRPAAVLPRRTDRLTIQVSGVEPTHLSKIVTGVIVPLKSQGATVTMQLVIHADAPNGIEPQVIELTVKETLKQLGLNATYEP